MSHQGMFAKFLKPQGSTLSVQALQARSRVRPALPQTGERPSTESVSQEVSAVRPAPLTFSSAPDTTQESVDQNLTATVTQARDLTAQLLRDRRLGEQKIEVLQKERDDCKEQLASLRATNDVLQQVNDQLERDMHAFKAEVESVKVRVANCEANNSFFQNVAENVEQGSEQARSDLGALKEKLESESKLKQKIAELEEFIKAQRQQGAKEVEEAIVKCKAQAAAERNAAVESAVRQEREKNTLEAQQAVAQAKTACEQDASSRLEEIAQKSEKRIEKSIKEKESAQAAFAQLQQEIQVYEQSEKELREQQSVLVAERERACQELTDQIKELEHAVEQDRAKYQELADQYRQAVAAAQQSDAEKEKHAATLTSMRSELEMFEKEKARGEAERQSALDLFQNASNEHRSVVERLEREKAELKSELKNFNQKQEKAIASMAKEKQTAVVANEKLLKMNAKLAREIEQAVQAAAKYKIDSGRRASAQADSRSAEQENDPGSTSAAAKKKIMNERRASAHAEICTTERETEAATAAKKKDSRASTQADSRTTERSDGAELVANRKTVADTRTKSGTKQPSVKSYARRTQTPAKRGRATHKQTVSEQELQSSAEERDDEQEEEERKEDSLKTSSAASQLKKRSGQAQAKGRSVTADIVSADASDARQARHAKKRARVAIASVLESSGDERFSSQHDEQSSIRRSLTLGTSTAQHRADKFATKTRPFEAKKAGWQEKPMDKNEKSDTRKRTLTVGKASTKAQLSRSPDMFSVGVFEFTSE